MSWFQRFITSVVPAAWAESMEAESRRWIAHCDCGCGQSVWDLGGIRWKASGSKRTYLRCPGCGRASWQKFVYEPDAPTTDQPR